MDETIFKGTNLGKRYNKIKKNEKMCLMFKGKKIPLVSKITVGRDKTNTIVLDDKMTSRFHAVIQKIDDEYFIKDLNSTNGSYVNNVLIPEDKYAKIVTNDIIKIGKTELSMV